MTPLWQAMTKALTEQGVADLEQQTRLCDAIGAVLHDQRLHGPTECDECTEEHCPDEGEHLTHAAIVEAVQMLHRQAHNGPSEPLDARRCHREPCAAVGGGLVSSGDARSLFAPGSRVVA